MRFKLSHILFIGVVLAFLASCSVHWTDAIKNGEIAQVEFNSSVAFEVEKGLIFVPVKIDGKTYRFLFDSGAPLSISKQLQQEFKFKKISEGTIKDSDHNRKKINWVELNELHINDISFLNQTAFVGDFKANPLLGCIQIDGIIGSNLLQQCNWTIDPEQNMLHFFDLEQKNPIAPDVTIPFKSDNQFNMRIDLKIGAATVRNVLIDYGSNGAVNLNTNIFKTLEENNIVPNTYYETGFQQSGIVGKPVPLNRKITLSDSVYLDNHHLKKIMLRTGKTVSIGNKLLSRFKVTIDWKNKALHLTAYDKEIEPYRPSGFKLGHTTEKGVYVQSVLQESIAFQKGIRPNMRVVQLDELHFEKENDFCDYVTHELGENIYILLIDSEGQKKAFNLTKTHLK